MIPTFKEKYKGFNIGYFIQCLKDGHNKKLKPIIENIFQCSIEKEKDINLLSNENKIKLCKDYVKEIGFKLPKRNEEYNKWNIGMFIQNLKNGQNKELKPIIEKIFKCKIEKIKKQNNFSDEKKIELCKDYVKEKGYELPSGDVIYKEWNIGIFIKGLKAGNNKHLKEQVENIFNCKIEKIKKQNNFSDEKKIELCQEYYNKTGQLPTYNIIYKEWNIGYFIKNIRKGHNKELKPIIEKIFNCKIE